MGLFTSLRNIFIFFFFLIVKVPHAQYSDSVDLCRPCPVACGCLLILARF